MVDAQALIFEQNEARISASRTELEATQAAAWENFQTALDTKNAALVAAIEAQYAAWTVNIEARNDTMASAAAAARQAIADAKATMVKALDSSEKEIRWAITSIYNYDYQDALNRGLDDARAAMDVICDARIDALEAQVVAVEDAWAAGSSSNTASVVANTDAEQ